MSDHDDFIESQYPQYVARFPDVFAWQVIRWGVPSVETMRRDRGSGSHAWPTWHADMRASEVFGWDRGRIEKQPVPHDAIRRDRAFAAAFLKGRGA